MDETAHDDALPREVRGRLGVLPNFLRLQPGAPDIAADLWSFARFGYLDNPLPSLFKERLVVHLSRLCDLRYCLARHVGFLVGSGGGRPAGDAACPPQSIEQAVRLIRKPLPRGDEIEPHVARLKATPPPAEPLLAADSPQEDSVLACAAHVFLQTTQAPRCLAALQAALGDLRFQHLNVLLSFVRTVHTWTIARPDLDFEDDVKQLLATHEELSACVFNVSEARDCRVSEQRFREMIDALPAAVYATDAHGRITHFNAACIAFSGRTPRLGDHWCVTWKLYHPDGTPMPHDECPMAITLKEERAVRGAEAIAERPDGTHIRFEPYPTPLFDDAGNLIGGINMLVDITNRKQAEEALRASEERYRQLANLLPAAVYTCDATGAITYHNPQAAELWGRRPRLGDPAERFCGSLELLLPDGQPLPHDQCPMAVALRDGSSFRQESVDIRRPDGSQISVRVNIDPIKDSAGRVVGAINVFHDVTELRRAGEAAARLAAIVESSEDAIISKDLDSIITSWNEGAGRIFGYAPEETVGRSIMMLIPEDRRDEETYILERLRQGERIAPFETKRRRKDGSLLDISLTISPVKDDQGRIIGASKIARDITERKRAEATLQLLVGELNHRVRNTLASVQAIAQQTLRHASDPERFVSSFTGRIQSLARVHSLLSAATWRSADLRELVSDQIRHGVADESRITAAGPRLQLSPQSALRMAMMLHELATNAVRHGALSVPDGWLTVTWAVEGQMLRLRWEERGGPPARVPTKPGFGTKLIAQSAEGEGGSARMLIEADGIVWEIVLPLPQLAAGDDDGSGAGRSLGSDQGRRPAQLAPKSAGKLAGARFLVVEDEPFVALELAESLIDAGAEVVASVGSSREALGVIETQQLDAALLDGNLHGQPVDAVAAALTQRRVPFAFVTGYGRDSLPRSFRHVAVLAKPFKQSELLDTAARMLERDAHTIRLQKT